jgi:hypothetical protein
MKTTKREKIVIIKKIIEMWGSLTDEIFDCKIVLDSAKVGKKFNDKYNIIQVIEKYNYSDVIVINYSDGNILLDNKIKYMNLSNEVLEKILAIIIKYDEIMLRKKE